jgi:predicted ATPase
VARASIRTPDQRLRVFVSSTLKELEPERRAARAAIERLHLAPVMFELGARPHPPRALYRSYLEQSDVFVGLYWERYGWVAPDEQISGLEDEYRLVGDLPRLIYIKEPAPDREDRLKVLLKRIQSDDRTAYKGFATPEELAALLEGDLATLLAERFDAAREQPQAEVPPATVSAPTAIPAAYTPIVGRDAERGAVLELLHRPGVRMVTLVGPGGIGKSRLAIDIAAAVAAEGRDVAFALLESVSTADRVITVIARAIGVRDGGNGPLEDKIVAALAGREFLLVVDNMEQVLEAADLIVRLITGLPRLTVLMTSRSPLRVRAEHTFEIGPLALPTADDPPDPSPGAAVAASVDLFVQRARAVRPSFALTPDNAAEVGALVRALDGVPLAIEIAAARIRSLSAAQILERLDESLALLVTGARDLPERQRTIRATIQWSVDLLDAPDRDALAVLGGFAGPFSVSTAEAVLTATGTAEPLDALDALVDASLLHQTDNAGISTLSLLTLVRTFARELGDDGTRSAAHAAIADHYRRRGLEAAVALRGPDQLDWLRTLELETANLAAVMRRMLDDDELEEAAEFAWSLYMFLWIGGYLGLVREWMSELLARAEQRHVELSESAQAIAGYYTNAILFWQSPGTDVVPGLQKTAELFERAGDPSGSALTRVSVSLALLSRRSGPDMPTAIAQLDLALGQYRGAGDAWGQAMVLVMLGRIDLVGGDTEAARGRFDESLTLATAQGERLGIVIALNHRGWARFLGGDVAGASADFAEALDMSIALGHDEGVAYGLEGFVGLRAAAGDARAAGLLLGAAQNLRRRKGILNPAAFEFYMIPVAALRESGEHPEFDEAIARGSTMSVDEVMPYVRD